MSIPGGTLPRGWSLHIPIHSWKKIKISEIPEASQASHCKQLENLFVPPPSSSNHIFINSWILINEHLQQLHNVMNINNYKITNNNFMLKLSTYNHIQQLYYHSWCLTTIISSFMITNIQFNYGFQSTYMCLTLMSCINYMVIHAIKYNYITMIDHHPLIIWTTIIRV